MPRGQFKPTQPLTLKDRLRALRNLPSFFKLVWQSGPGMMLGNVVLRFVKASLPFLLLYVGKLIIDQVVHLAKGGGGHSTDVLWKLVAIEFGLAILSDALTRAITLMDSLLGDLF